MKNLFKDLIRPYVPFFLKQLNKILKYKRLTISDIKPDVNDFYKNLASNLQYNIIFDAGTFVGDYPLKLKKDFLLNYKLYYFFGTRQLKF